MDTISKHLRAATAVAFVCFAAAGGLCASEVLTFAWSGGVTDHSASVVCQTVADSDDVELVVSASADLSSPVYTSPAGGTDAQRIVRFDAIDGLDPDTDYYFGISVDGVLESTLNDAYNGTSHYTGRFRTHPTAGTASSYAFVFGCCIRTGEIGNEPVFDTMRAHDPLFWLCSGDFHYGDVPDNDPSAFRSAMESRLVADGAGTRLAALSRSTSFYYMWDDHDFGPNNSRGAGKTDSYKQAAHLVYRQYVPHGALPLAGDAAFVADEEPIAQAFTVGRVRYIFTDLRSESTASDVSEATKLGPRQKRWFKEELLKANGSYPIIVWLTSVPWNGDDETGDSDRWQYFTEERREIADFIHQHDITGLCALSGDMHGTAIDDGSNTLFTSDGEGAGFPLFHASPLSNKGSYKGGPYSEGQISGGDGDTQFGLVEFTDDGDTITVTMTGKDEEDETLIATTDAPGNPITYTFDRSNPMLVETRPADGATDVGVNVSLRITFDEAVALGTGAIEIRALDDDSLIQSIEVDGGAVTVDGSVATIAPPSLLPEETACHVTIASSCFNDLDGNPFAGISHATELDYRKWDFTTGGGPARGIRIEDSAAHVWSMQSHAVDPTADGMGWLFEGLFSDENHVLAPNLDEDG